VFSLSGRIQANNRLIDLYHIVVLVSFAYHMRVIMFRISHDHLRNISHVAVLHSRQFRFNVYITRALFAVHHISVIVLAAIRNRIRRQTPN